MLKSANQLEGAVVEATDGEVGKVEQVYFDDQKWTVRYLIVQTGSWLLGRKVLISPVSVKQVDWDSGRIMIGMDRNKVEGSPDIDSAKPVSRQMEMKYHEYFDWPYYWGGTSAWGMAPYPWMLARPLEGPAPYELPPAGDIEGSGRAEGQQDQGEDVHLRSSREVIGYYIQSTDARFGKVEDLIVDDRSWLIRYLVVDLRHWLPGKRVLVSPKWVDSVSWTDEVIRVHVDRDLVRHSPQYDPDRPIDQDYEESLHRHYGKAG